MQPVRLSTRLISGARMLPRSFSISRPAVCFSRHQHRCYSRSARLHDRSFAFPVEPRDLASKDVPTANQTFERVGGSRFQDEVIPASFIHTAEPVAAWHPAYLRDMCRCPRCRDPSSTQKTFQTTDIPEKIQAREVDFGEDGSVSITWENDIPGFGPDHVTTFSKDFLYHHLTQRSLAEARFEPPEPRVWSKKKITRELQSITFEDYMKDEEALYRALFSLNLHGILLLKGVPESETAVEDITSRMGTLRDTFYGRTWDVKSVPEAKNVAYTHQYLGLHMDLLYMANPPGFQLLHCLKNTCEGGSSLFSDSFAAVGQLHWSHIKQLTDTKIGYQYKNAGEHYYFEHPVIETQNYNSVIWEDSKVMKHVNYSPPFQADHLQTAWNQASKFSPFLTALKKFADRVEDPDYLYEYKMQEGDCVIFNNRRVLHGRREFDAAHGERWLKGAYVDTDVFMSRFRVLNEKYELKGVEILEDYVEKDLGLELPKPKEPKPIKYGPLFKKKEKKGPLKKVYVDQIA
ncbi:Clavaminate synthase-like protein [Stipitochalara longipes BDJ]|nr:Clavaminate synthase-like protein [Stipitochalara longipes BDJ]